MTPIDVRIDRLGKQYRLGVRRNAGSFWALKEVTFDVPRGTSVGVIGRNGAGKSTLLKVLAGITAPTSGSVTIDGRLAALIEVGSGFHPELTGRENVFLSASILGMRRDEIAAKLPTIVEFAGVERFIDTPVKWYSSGMYVRLGFSIAAHLEPDVLLVDEVLAVGDAEFQVKCLTRIRDLKRQGITTIFISHDLTAVEQLCDTAVLLDKGEVMMIGEPAHVVSEYHRRMTTAATETAEFASIAREGALKITGLTFGGDPSGLQALSARTGDPLVVSVRYAAARQLDPVVFEITYYSSDGKTTIATARTDQGGGVRVLPPGGIIEFVCDPFLLKRGAYYVGVVVREAVTRHVIDWWDGGTNLFVEAGTEVNGQFYMPHTWRVTHADETTPSRPRVIPNAG
jgi:ABC-type polysaccharide/polyol phosphate transport system ATPase subunit